MRQNVILPGGDVQIGRFDYDVYANNQVDLATMNRTPIKIVGQSPVRFSDIGQAKDSYSLQYNAVRVDGQRSVYLPVLKQGGDSNTIAVVNGVRAKLQHLFDVPKSLSSTVVFDQSAYVKTAIETLLHEGGIGLFLTCLMILIFLGSMRAMVAVFFSIPLSVLAAFIALQIGGSSINSMVLGGFALALSRLIDNSVVVLENIFRHMELGEPPAVAAEKGGQEVALPVLAGTLTTVVVFFPVTLLYGVSKFLFSALALAVVLSLFASYFVAMTVVPLFCARYIKHSGLHATAGTNVKAGFGTRFNSWFNLQFTRLLTAYEAVVARVMILPAATLWACLLLFSISLLLFSAGGTCVLSPDRRGTVCNHLESTFRYPVAGYGKRSGPGGTTDPQYCPTGRHGHDCLEYRRRSRLFSCLYFKCRNAHGCGAGQLEARSPGGEL